MAKIRVLRLVKMRASAPSTLSAMPSVALADVNRVAALRTQHWAKADCLQDYRTMLWDHPLTINQIDKIYYHFELIIFLLFMKLECPASGSAGSMAY